MSPSALPAELPTEFSTGHARLLGISPARLRGNDLDGPFRGARILKQAVPAETNRYEQAKERELALIRALGARLVDGQFLSHRSSAMLWEAPVPSKVAPELHATAFRPKRAPRIRGVQGHTAWPERARAVEREGVFVATPATVFTTSGTLPLAQIVALGDYFVRKYRPGYGRRNVGRAPLATIGELAEPMGLGHWLNMARLQLALSLLREDAWSPMESVTRVHLVHAGLPEPELNIDVFDTNARFMGCRDMVFPQFKVAVEYQGIQHSERYAEDIERYQLFEAEGWKIIQVTKVLAAHPEVMTARVAAALRERGWDGRA